MGIPDALGIGDDHEGGPGPFFAGIGGGLLVEFVGAFNTSSWTSPETFVIFAAIIIGGLGNNLGAVVGSLVVPVLFVELPKFLPSVSGNPGLIPVSPATSEADSSPPRPASRSSTAARE